jgi:hypothetical protein
MDELLKRSGSTSFEDNAGGGGALGWNWTDVGHENRMAIRFFESLDGWEEGWLCNWMAFAVA